MAKSCPISNRMTDQKAVRLTAFCTVATLTLYLIYQAPLILLLLIIDWSLRLTKGPKFSVISILCGAILKMLHSKPQRINAAPKEFASRFGLTLTIVSFLFAMLGLRTTSYIIATCVIIAASLEAFFSYCVGCEIYSLLNRNQ